MNLQEAYSELEANNSFSEEQLKKQFKTLSKKYHPDINKEPGSEEKFKKINEAYQTITNPKESPYASQYSGVSGFHGSPFEDFFSNVRMRKTPPPKNISLSQHISFKESVFGTSKEIEFERLTMCNNCNGEGSYKINNGCTNCSGKGVIIQSHGNVIYSQTCSQCHGLSKSEPCKECNETGAVNTNTKVSVKIPGGIKNNNILQLQGIGNYTVNPLGMEGYTNVLLTITVDESSLSIVDNDVVSSISIPLINAVKGFTTSVETVSGQHEITIPKLSKNKDEVIIPNLGVNKTGNHRVILNVEYPDNIQSILEQ